jgi:hypothetical protein
MLSLTYPCCLEDWDTATSKSENVTIRSDQLQGALFRCLFRLTALERVGQSTCKAILSGVPSPAFVMLRRKVVCLDWRQHGDDRLDGEILETL